MAVARSVKRSSKRADPRSDPRYKRVVDKLNADSRKLKQHPPPSKKSDESGKAAKGPANEKSAGARANQVDKLEEAETPKPQTSSFLEMLRAEIAKVMPKTLGDTEKFMKGGSGNEIKSSLKGEANAQKDAATGDLKQTSNATPSEAGVPGKPVTPIPPEPGAPAPSVNAAEAMPAPKPDAEVSLEASKTEVADAKKDTKQTDERLKNANDPRFSSVMTAEKAVQKQADAGPGKYRGNEGATLTKAAGQAIGVSKKGVSSLLSVKGGSKTKVASKQDQQKAREEQELKKFSDFVTKTFEDTKTSVDKRLATLEETVNTMFDTGTDAALAKMKSYVEDALFKYKIDRYLLRIGGALLWIKDQILDLPPEVSRFYEAGRNLFTAAMDALATRVANHVEKELAGAKGEVSQAQAKIATAQAALSPGVRARGAQVTAEYADKFNELKSGIEDKKQQLAEGLAQKYKEAFDKADEALKAIQDENKGLVTKAKEKIAEVAKALMEFKDRLMGILRKGADTIDLILDNPGQFLSNLIAAIKGGFQAFAGNILGHLQRGFVKWLFGALSGAGIEIPGDLSLPSILKLVLGVLGITYDKMRAKAVKLLGPTAVTLIEKLVSYVQTLIGGGPAALWEQIKGDLSNLKDMVIGAIQDWIVSTIVKKAVAKVVSMFNPAGAIIQAILMIVDVVMFVVERASQIMEFVESVINSIHAIATGSIGGAISKVEQALGNMIPLLIGFLASLIGLGGISAKIKAFILKVQTKVDQAIDKVLKKAVAFVKKMFGKLTGKSDSPEEKQKRLDEGSAAALAAVNKYSGKKVGMIVLKPLLLAVKIRYRMTSLEPVKQGDKWAIRAEVNPVKITQTTIGAGPTTTEVEVGYESHWPLDEFKSKANAIKRAAEGKTANAAQTLSIDTTTGKQKSTKPLRQGGQDRFRGQIHAAIGRIPDVTDKAAALGLMNKLQADHQQELQMGGTDTDPNMAMIEQRMNSQMGGMFRGQLKNLAPDTKIDKVVVETATGTAPAAAHRESGSANELQTLLLKYKNVAASETNIRNWFKIT